MSQETLTREQVEAICEELESIVSDQYNEETAICFFPQNMNRVWIDAKDLDWLADELQEPEAERLRQIMKYGMDGEGAYYFYDF